MKFRILVNECRIYRVERLSQTLGEWVLCCTTDLMAENGERPIEFGSSTQARDWIQTEIEAPEQERKRNTWKVVEEIE